MTINWSTSDQSSPSKSSPSHRWMDGFWRARYLEGRDGWRISGQMARSHATFIKRSESGLFLFEVTAAVACCEWRFLRRFQFNWNKSKQSEFKGRHPGRILFLVWSFEEKGKVLYLIQASKVPLLVSITNLVKLMNGFATCY